MATAVAMADLFEGIQKLPDPVPGCPNLRRVPGYKVYCCGQPTVAGFEAALTKVCGDIYPKDGKIIWLNLRQEPNVYINGEPVSARPANKIGEYAELGNVTRDIIKKNEIDFFKDLNVILADQDEVKKLEVIDVNKVKKEVEVKEFHTLSTVIEGVKEKFPGLVHMRVPICNSAAPLESDFDVICETLVGSSINTPIIVSDQVGLSRATTGCVIACLFKEFQISASYDGLVETVPGMNPDFLKMDNYKMNMDKDPLFRGEFEVVNKLLKAIPDGPAAKNVCDKIIDKNGTPKTGGTGIKQLRENIAETKLSYEIMDDAAQVFLKTKIMDNIQKYFYLIAFSAYLRSIEDAARSACSDEIKATVTLTGGKCSIPASQLTIPRKFVDFMNDNNSLRDMVEEGKGDLQWERDIPPGDLVNFEKLAEQDFQGNLGTIIHDIYQTAHVMFGDMPPGDHKKRAKYRFASKTLSRILPEALRKQVEGLIEKNEISLDLYEILGVCTWGQKKVF